MRFDHPQFLGLVLALPVLTLLFLWWTGRVKRRLLTRFIQARLLPGLMAGESGRRTQGRALLLAGAAALLALALARPQWGDSWEEATQKGLDIVIAIDTSKSMLAEDVRPNRLTRARLAALDLMRLARADRLGLIAFAGDAFLVCPLTFDDGVFRQSVNDLNVNTIPQGGTAVASAIRAATRALQDDQNFQVLVLMTDGEDHDPDALAAAREAAQAGLRIYTIGLGSPEGELLRITDAQGRTDFIRDREGQVVKSRLNEALLQEIATAAQGFYLPLRGADTMEILYERGLAPLPKSESEARLFRRYHEQYHWPLALAIVLLSIEMVWPRRTASSRQSPPATARATPSGSAVAAALALLLAVPTLTEASASRAQRAFDAGTYEEALREFDRLREEKPEDARLHYNAGVAAYRAGRLDEALERFNAAIAAPDLQLQQQAYYNRGNSHYRLGERRREPGEMQEAWKQAVQDYETALKLNDADAEAQFNLDFVRQRLEELEQMQQEQQEQQNQQGDSQDQQQQPDQDQQRQPDEQQPSDDRQRQSGQDQPPDQDDQRSQPDQRQEDQPDADEQPSPQPGDQQEQKEEQQAQAGETQPEEGLTPEQAERLLDALKGNEQLLPLQRLMPQPRQPPERDW